MGRKSADVGITYIMTRNPNASVRKKVILLLTKLIGGKLYCPEIKPPPDGRISVLGQVFFVAYFKCLKKPFQLDITSPRTPVFALTSGSLLDYLKGIMKN